MVAEGGRARAIGLEGGEIAADQTLPVNDRVRARGNVAGGWQNSSTGTIESVTSFTILTPQEIWRQTYFGSPANTGNGADLFDSDADGYVNLLEFAFGLNPTQNSAGQLPQLDTSGGYFTYSFTQPNGISGLTYGAEWSVTLLPGSWTSILDTGASPQHTFSVPIGADTKKFIRLQITSP